MRHSRSYRVISEFHLCIFAVSLFHVSLPGKTEKSAKPITSRLCGYKKDHATDCLNKQFTLRGVFHMEVTTRFELVNEGFADLCLTTWPRHHMSEKSAYWADFPLFFWSGRRGSNSLPPPWQGGALPDELRPHNVYSLRRTYKKLVPPIGIEPMTRGFSVPCSTDWATEANGDPNQARTDDL